MPAYPKIKTRIPNANDTSIQMAQVFDRDDADLFGPRRVASVALRDLFGTKDVQDAITASYVWMADQVGHIALGGTFTLLLCWIVTGFLVGPGVLSDVLCFASALAVLSIWIWKEVVDFRDVSGRKGNAFAFNTADIKWNIKTALFFFGVGGFVTALAFINGWVFLAVLFLLSMASVRMGFWWLKRKIAFQQAGLPYLFRLANFVGDLTDQEKRVVGQIANMRDRQHGFRRVIFEHDPVPEEPLIDPEIRHLIVSGPLSSGKTTLAVGLGTEFAFTLGLARYLSAVRLLELAAKGPQGQPEMEPNDGRILWPWQDCHLLIIDDVDVGVRRPAGEGGTSIQPQEFKQQVINLFGSAQPLDFLANRRSVWVVGDPAAVPQWQAAIAQLMGIQQGQIMVIELDGRQQQPGPNQGAQQPGPNQGAPQQPGPNPPPVKESKFKKGVGAVAGGLGAILLALTTLWWWHEGRWGAFQDLTPRHAFADGSFGMEFAPLKFLLVVSDISPGTMTKSANVSWPERFGLARREDSSSGMCVKDAPSNLPLGFSVSNRSPVSGTPLPVKFVGMTCAACHSTQIGDTPILGAATQSADLIGFQDAFASAVLDKNVTAEAIVSKYREKCPMDPATPVVTGVGFVDRSIETYLISKWLNGTREGLREISEKYDLAFDGKEIDDPKNIPTGPSRSRPFRSVIRNALDLPAGTNNAISKMPAVFMQKYKTWSQFDGSIKNHVARSLVAVFASNASLPALDERQIAYNVKQAADFTKTLGEFDDETPDERPKIPTLLDMFPEMKQVGDATKGRALYEENCHRCHGSPGREPNTWVMPEGKPDPFLTPVERTVGIDDVIGTDPERVQFRYADMLPDALINLLPRRGREADDQVKALNELAEKKYADRATGESDWWYRYIDSSSRDSKATSKTVPYVGDFMQRRREFPAGHRLAPALAPGEIKRQPPGYQNAPIPFVWLRAPYLHNGSVPTLRALIGLDGRPDKFCRGNTGYDPKAVGLNVPALGAPCEKNKDAPFLFDASIPGNSNKGHYWPDPAKETPPEALEDLLAYLRTL